MDVVRGSVLTEDAGMLYFTRHSMIAHNESILSSLDEFKEQERFSITDMHWNLKQLRVQIKQRNMESLYNRYVDKLRLGYLSIFLIVMIFMSLTHLIILVSISSVILNEIVALICYSLQIIVPIPIVIMLYMDRLKRKFDWLQPVLSVTIILILIVLDISVPALTKVAPALRPAYYTNTLLACYIFLPITNNLLALLLGTIVSFCHIALMSLVTYSHYEESRMYRMIGGDLLYLFAVNLLGIYFRFMNEIMTRRSFLDRTNCLESTFKLNFEKEQEERLLLSILPEHIALTIKDDIRKIAKQIKHEEYDPLPIQDSRYLYIKEHDNVSILYADIVNYTMMSTKLQPKVLVETLNELFAKFDEAAEDNDVLRIKFLGDCYYCVSGVPKPNSQHAKSCVDLGLEMISIIKDVRESRNLDIDMRIGIHSGKILSGIIGIRKWQYDIWSKDVTIANAMESAGKPGKVHITKRTLEELKESARDYIIEPNYEASENSLLAKYKIESYLLSTPSKHSNDYYSHRVQYKRPSVSATKFVKKGIQKSISSQSRPEFANGRLSRSRSTFIDNNHKVYRKMMRDADTQMSAIIDQMPTGIWGKYSKDCNNNADIEKSMSGRTLFFLNAKLEKDFINEPDLLFKHYVALSLLVFLITICIQAITIAVISWKTVLINAILGFMLIILQPLNWMKFFWEKKYGRTPPKNKFLVFLYRNSESLIKSASSRTIVHIFICFMLSVSSFINLTECKYNAPKEKSCIPPWQLTQATFLTLLLGYLFSRVFFVMRWAVGIIINAMYLWIIWDIKSDVYKNGATWNYDMDPRIAQTMAVVFMSLTLHLIDRQAEFRCRLDYRWKKKLIEKQTDATGMKLENNLLLYNILPVHVAPKLLERVVIGFIPRITTADKYLNTGLVDDELYYEEYECVSVMFATLTNYRFADDESVTSEAKLLKYLNYLISDFDKLLFAVNDKRLKVEKIKMAGWTYMAACGLDPGQHRASIFSDTESQRGSLNVGSDGPIRSQQSYEDEIVLRMVEFAASMNEKLNEFNRSAFQNINLKIGISHGEVTAGVVGSSKPLYDIWGHAVNMASRMASTGTEGLIQVTENTAIVLDRQGVLTKCRGNTFVKGAGDIRTYFVPLDENGKLVYKEAVSYEVKNNDDELEITKF